MVTIQVKLKNSDAINKALRPRWLQLCSASISLNLATLALASASIDVLLVLFGDFFVVSTMMLIIIYQ